MLKITKGLKPPIINDNSNGISIYTDEEGNEYVRVKNDNEDFCIAAHDYVKDSKDEFEWDEAMRMLKTDGLTLPTREQAELYASHLKEINDMLREMGHRTLHSDWYWTSTVFDTNNKLTWFYKGGDGVVSYIDIDKNKSCRVRLVLNL